MQFEEDELRPSDEDPEFTGAADTADDDDEFLDDDATDFAFDDDETTDDEDEDELPAADL